MKRSSILVLATAITVVFGTAYVLVQQSLRLGANDPQIQIAEDTAAKLNSGTQIDSLATSIIDISHSLTPFVVLYDKSGQPVAGSGYLNGKLPNIPKGVLTAANGKTYNAVTWQPQSTTRIAAVAVSSNDYYVVSGRSLHEVESRESTILKLTALGWTLAMLVLVILLLPGKRAGKQKSKSKRRVNARATLQRLSLKRR